MRVTITPILIIGRMSAFVVMMKSGWPPVIASDTTMMREKNTDLVCESWSNRLASDKSSVLPGKESQRPG